MKLLIIILLSILIVFLFRLVKKKPAEIRSRKRRILDRLGSQE